MSAPAVERRAVVLLVEDNLGDAELLQALLGEVPDDEPEVVHVERLGAALALLASRAVDVALLDLSLPDARGLTVVDAVHHAAPQLPIVVMTGLDDEAVAVHALQAGAQDYLVKGAVTGAGVRRAIRHARERQRLLDAAVRATNDRDLVLGVVAHDLRNPLGAVRMCASALAATDPPTIESVQELSGVILSSVELMERIIRDLLDVSAIEAGRLAVDLEHTRVATVLARARSLAAPLAAEQGLALEVRTPADDVAVRADAERLQQALGNLLGNAVKFTQPGGRVTLAATATPDGRAVRFEVSDTGRGVPPEHLPHLFDRFWQARETRRGGAGLGLAIVKGIVEAHGGTVGVASVPNEGTTFWFALPRDS